MRWRSLGDSNPCFRRERARLRLYSIVSAALAPACPRPRVLQARASVHRGRAAPHSYWARAADRRTDSSRSRPRDWPWRSRRVASRCRLRAHPRAPFPKAWVFDHRLHARHHDYIADPEAGRSRRHLVDDEIRALGNERHAQACLVHLGARVMTDAYRPLDRCCPIRQSRNCLVSRTVAAAAARRARHAWVSPTRRFLAAAPQATSLLRLAPGRFQIIRVSIEKPVLGPLGNQPILFRRRQSLFVRKQPFAATSTVTQRHPAQVTLPSSIIDWRRGPCL